MCMDFEEYPIQCLSLLLSLQVPSQKDAGTQFPWIPQYYPPLTDPILSDYDIITTNAEANPSHESSYPQYHQYYPQPSVPPYSEQQPQDVQKSSDDSAGKSEIPQSQSQKPPVPPLVPARHRGHLEPPQTYYNVKTPPISPRIREHSEPPPIPPKPYQVSWRFICIGLLITLEIKLS